MQRDLSFQVRRLDARGAVRHSLRLWDLPEAQLYSIDFSDLKWVEPFGMLLFASRLRTFAAARRPARFRALNYEHLGYAAHMGFFQSFGLCFGKDPGEAPGGTQYIPVTVLELTEVEREAADEYRDPREIIERRSEALASILTREEGGDLQDTLSYSLREIFRNVLEHSKAKQLWYAAQYWPEKDTVELCILDEGIGVRESLAKNPHITVHHDHDAIRLALLPGISGIAFKGARQESDPWRNSGYGLFMTSQLCGYGGSFMICSGTQGLVLDSGRQSVYPINFPGTALRLEIFAPAVRRLSKVLEELREKGRAIAGELRQCSEVTASMSSRMLSRDFPR